MYNVSSSDKHHLARLLHVYTKSKTLVNNSRPELSGKKISPGTRLYGLNGIQCCTCHANLTFDVFDQCVGILSHESKEHTFKLREKGWDQHIDITEKLDRTRLKSIEKFDRRANETFVKNQYQSTSTKKMSPSTSSQSLSHYEYTSTGKTSSDKSKQRRDRVDCHRRPEGELSDLELIINNYYELDNDQLHIYDTFTSMISQFDHTIMVQYSSSTVLYVCTYISMLFYALCWFVVLYEIYFIVTKLVYIYRPGLIPTTSVCPSVCRSAQVKILEDALVEAKRKTDMSLYDGPFPPTSECADTTSHAPFRAASPLAARSDQAMRDKDKDTI